LHIETPTRFEGTAPVARNDARPSPPWDDEDETDIGLIRGMQAELRRAITAAAPDEATPRASDLFYKAYHDLIRRYAARCGVRNQDLDDCVQAVFVKVINSLPRFERQGLGSFRRWLFLLVHSEATDTIRRYSRHPAQSLSEIEGTEREPVDPRLDPAAESQRQFEAELVQTCLEQLSTQVSELDYKVVRLRWIEGKRPAEIAALLGLSEQAVWSRRKRMRLIVRTRVNFLRGHRFDISVPEIEDRQE
jgi:RNA polymerase sigma factor (sigma-70 family)